MFLKLAYLPQKLRFSGKYAVTAYIVYMFFSLPTHVLRTVLMSSFISILVIKLFHQSSFSLRIYTALNLLASALSYKKELAIYHTSYHEISFE